MSHADGPSKTVLSDDALPPVQPPSAGFILQLFVVPGLIVAIIVGVWLSVNWLAHKGSDVDAYVRAIERNNDARWQAAVNLALALRDEESGGKSSIRRSAATAKKLADLLQREIAAGSLSKEPITFRVYLCRALGEFETAEGIPVLLTAATTRRGDAEEDVQRAALEAIGNVGAAMAAQDKPIAHADLESTLTATAADANPLVREAAAFALGGVGKPSLREPLVKLLDDSHPNARYNAATGLARAGDEACIGVLVEMLDPNETAGVDGEKYEAAKAIKREAIYLNALRGVQTLARENPSADLAAVAEQLEKLLKTQIGTSLRVHVQNTLLQIKKRPPAEAAPARTGSRERSGVGSVGVLVQSKSN